ncbi:MAG TPA: hypothetical protein VK507_16555 [Iamia sp.]|nr:hypothetical protein [Iamia sp.]
MAGAAGLAVSNRAGEGAAAPVVGQQTAGEGAEVTEPAPMEPTEENPMASGNPYWGHRGLPVGPTPPGKEPIAFNDGGVPGLAGYIDDEGPNGWDVPPPVLDVGSGRYEATGKELTDANGVLLGYAVSGVGLVDLATASDVETMDVLLAEGEAKREAADRRNAELAEDEEEMARLFGDGFTEGGG